MSTNIKNELSTGVESSIFKSDLCIDVFPLNQDSNIEICIQIFEYSCIYLSPIGQRFRSFHVSNHN